MCVMHDKNCQKLFIPYCYLFICKQVASLTDSTSIVFKDLCFWRSSATLPMFYKARLSTLNIQKFIETSSQNCLQFAEGYYGTNCTSRCTCQHGDCNHVTGLCDVCRPGWEGDLCDRRCTEGYYGNNCNQTCLCQNDGRCNHINGTCTCASGWRGEVCAESCPSGTYGRDCLLECACSNGGTCRADNGECVCTPGYHGTFCDNPCSGWWWIHHKRVLWDKWFQNECVNLF